MMAIVDIKGQQFKIRENQSLYVHRVEAAEGEQIEFDTVLLLENGSGVQIGKPYVSGARVRAQVVSHVEGDKVLVFKKKRRKGYQKMNGHRQQFTKLSIQSIG
jgi:large subunit ribosomal protein L21